jgi:hypothetical protein
LEAFEEFQWHQMTFSDPPDRLDNDQWTAFGSHSILKVSATYKVSIGQHIVAYCLPYSRLDLEILLSIQTQGLLLVAGTEQAQYKATPSEKTLLPP